MAAKPSPLIVGVCECELGRGLPNDDQQRNKRRDDDRCEPGRPELRPRRKKGAARVGGDAAMDGCECELKLAPRKRQEEIGAGNAGERGDVEQRTRTGTRERREQRGCEECEWSEHEPCERKQHESEFDAAATLARR